MTDFAIDELDEERKRPQKDRPKFGVIHEDDRIIVFDKAAGVSSIRERYVTGVSLKEIAEERYGRLWTVHRIDKDTTGVIVFARDAEAHRQLNDQFEHHEVVKIYAAVLEGEMVEQTMTIDIPLAVDPRDAVRMRPSARGKESITLLAVRERFRGFTCVEAQPRTGRQHQIRVHCKAVGLPLAVDPLYGNRSELYLSALKRSYRGYDREEKPLIARLTLHAEQLTIRHPGTSASVTYAAPHPRDFQALLTQLRKARRV